MPVNTEFRGDAFSIRSTTEGNGYIRVIFSNVRGTQRLHAMAGVFDTYDEALDTTLEQIEELYTHMDWVVCERVLANDAAGCSTCGFVAIDPGMVSSQLFTSLAEELDYDGDLSELRDSVRGRNGGTIEWKWNPKLLEPGVPKPAFNDNLITFGVELEGILPEKFSENEFRLWCGVMPRGGCHGDGSVCPTTTVGTPLEALFYTSTLEEMKEWLDICYGDWGIVPNHTCGFHVHIKPRPELMWAMATKPYWDGFVEAYNDYAKETSSPKKYRERITNHYSAVTPWSWENVSQRTSRYQAINLCSVDAHHTGAVEHRILPFQESPQEAITSLKWLLGTASDLLDTVKRSKVEFTDTVRQFRVTEPNFGRYMGQIARDIGLRRFKLEGVNV
jgi:hypothetical protein